MKSMARRPRQQLRRPARLAQFSVQEQERIVQGLCDAIIAKPAELA